MGSSRQVTLVHTDIEGSTRLWERCPAAMSPALAEHDRIQRELIDRFGGYELRTEGDAFLIGFNIIEEALEFACALQHALLEADWPEALLELSEGEVVSDESGRVIRRGLRVRVGLCSGQVESRVDNITGRIGMRGSLVHRCIAIASAASGGQILADRADIAEPPSNALLTEIGFERPSGLRDGLELVQITPDALVGREFGPLRRITEDKTNIAAPPDETVGRSQLVERLLGELLAGDRCITITGPAGVGKSRLAQIVLSETTHAFRSGTWAVALASAKTTADVLQTVAEVLDVPLGGGDETAHAATLGQAMLSRGRMALLFDDADLTAPLLGDLVKRLSEACPQLFILITSRRTVPGLPVTCRVQPLSPRDGAELFVQRAKERRARLQLDERELEACRAIAKALDGLPLALELAASRVGVMTPRLILERLDERFKLLRGRRRGDDRQSTLASTLAWSWDLLSLEGQAALMAFSPCRGHFDRETAAAQTELEGDDLDRVLRELEDNSMLTRRSDNRFEMTESLRMFAEDKAGESKELLRFQRRHAKRFATIGLALYQDSYGAKAEACLRRIRRERANLMQAYALSAKRDPELAACAALGLVPVLFTQGPMAVGISLFQELAPDIAQIPNPVRAMFRMVLARVQNTMGERRLALRSAHQAAEEARAHGDPALIADANETLIRTYSMAGRFPEARRLIKRSLRFARAEELPSHEARLQAAIGSLLFRMGKTDKALEAFEFAAAGFEPLGLAYPQAQALSNAGILHLAAGHRESAESCFLVALRQYELMQHHTELARAHGHLGLLALDAGDLELARTHYEASLTTGRRIGSAQAVVAADGYLGLIDQLRGRNEQAMIRYREAMTALGSHSLGRVEAYLRCFYAGLLAQTGSPEEAETNWHRAQSMMEPLNDPFIDALVALTRAQASGDAVELEPELEAKSEDLRFARRLLEL